VEQEYLDKIKLGYEQALRRLSLADLDEEDEDRYFEEAEVLFHCETCTMRELLEIFWPPVQEYIDWLRAEAGLQGEAYWS
jgi:hypothetical protein